MRQSLRPSLHRYGCFFICLFPYSFIYLLFIYLFSLQTSSPPPTPPSHHHHHHPQQVTGRPPILRTEGLPRTVWANAWVHGRHGPMHSVALVNYDGNATTNVLHGVAEPFSISLRCDHAADHATGGDGWGWGEGEGRGGGDVLGCVDIVHASITCTTNGSTTTATTTPLALTRTDHDGYSVLNVTIPGHTIQACVHVCVSDTSFRRICFACKARIYAWLRLSQYLVHLTTRPLTYSTNHTSAHPTTAPTAALTIPADPDPSPGSQHIDIRHTRALRAPSTIATSGHQPRRDDAVTPQ